MSVPSGGSSTINGVTYQMLWSLLQASRMRVLDASPTSEDVAQSSAVIVLEPIGGGGDATVTEAGVERVVQLKSRSGGGAWSFREIVNDVIPDLFRGVRLDARQEFVLVTEGRQGKWGSAAKFFSRLRERRLPSEPDRVPDALDDERPISFSGTLPAVPEHSIPELVSPSTERRLFLAIAERLRCRKVEADSPRDETHRKLWKLLANFSVEEGLTPDNLRAGLRERLRPVVNHVERLDETILAMLADLARRAAQGGAVIDPLELYTAHDIRAAPLTDWNALVARSSTLLQQAFASLNYRPAEDERLAQAQQDFDSWSAGDPLHLALSGESGQGKSWRLAAMASVAARHAPVILFRTSGNAQSDRAEAERLFAHLWGQDQAIPLGRIAERLGDVLPELYGPWLYVFLDDVQSYSQIEALIQMMPHTRVRVALAATRDITDRLAARYKERLSRLTVTDFTEEEAKGYVVQGDEARWQEIPRDVRALLSRPLLADLYRGTARFGWVPTDEYDLFDRHYTEQYRSPIQDEHPGALRLLGDAAIDAWEGGAYPWPLDELVGRGLAEPTLKFLVQIGWLQRDEDDRYRIWHDRLLAWEIAASLARGARTGRRDFARDAARCGEGFSSNVERHPIGASGYVAMDLAWQLTNSGPSEALNVLLFAMEGDYLREEQLYKKLLPTLGPKIVPALARRVVEISSPHGSITRHRIAEAIASFEGEQVVDSALRLLTESDSEVRRASLEILSSRPSHRAVEPLYSLRQRLLREAEIERGEDEARRSTTVWERSEIWPALRACAATVPDWVETKIVGSESGDESLGMLTSFLQALPDGRERWLRLKKPLREKLRPEDRRHYAGNAGFWRDSEEAAWLAACVRESATSFLAATCLRALGRIDSSLALNVLGDISPNELAMSRKWTLAPLIAESPVETSRRMTALIRERPWARWDYADAYADLPNELSEDALDVLLNDLSERLTTTSIDSLYRKTSALEGFQSPQLLTRLQQRAGSELEDRLTDGLIRHGSRSSLMMDTTGKPAVTLLYKIGGEGFTRLLNFWLSADERYGRWDGIEAAPKRPDAETLRLLRNIALDEPAEDEDAASVSWAGEALARADDWEGAVDHIIAKAGSVQRETIYSRWGLEPLPAESVASATRKLADEPEHAGAILAAGFGKHHELASHITEVLQASSDAALKTDCLWALHLMQNLPQASVPTVAKCLASTEHGPMAEIVLQNDGSRIALAALLDDFRRRCEDTPPRSYSMGEPEDLADSGIYLMRKDAVADDASGLLKDRLGSGSTLNSYNASFLRRLGRAVSLPELRELLDQPHIVAFLKDESFREDGRFRRVGDKAASIRILGALHPDLGYIAAFRVLRNPEAHDREWMPSLLLEWDADKATPELLDFACEATLPMKTIVARAFRAAGLFEPVLKRLDSSRIAERACACFLLGYAEPSPETMRAVSDRLDDGAEKVHVAAYKALHALRAAATTKELVTAFRAETDRGKRWILLDAAITAGEPGDEHAPAPEWYLRMMAGEAPALWRYASKRLEKQRAKAAKKIEDEVRRESD